MIEQVSIIPNDFRTSADFVKSARWHSILDLTKILASDRSQRASASAGVQPSSRFLDAERPLTMHSCGGPSRRHSSILAQQRSNRDLAGACRRSYILCRLQKQDHWHTVNQLILLSIVSHLLYYTEQPLAIPHPHLCKHARMPLHNLALG